MTNRTNIELVLAAGDVPIYQQIVDQVRAACVRGALAPGDALPTVRELAAQLGLNRNTVAHAYRLLREQGVLAGRSGQGTVVAAPAAGTAVQCFGSHDFGLDVLARQLPHFLPGVRLAATPVGSTAGVAAVASGAAQLAGLHLFDAISGTFNRAFLARLAPDADLELVTLAEREQGLIVLPGNPLGLRSATDLARPGLRWAGRQPGSGTQLLLDYLLAREGLSIAQLSPPARVRSTHLAIAAAVAGGAADVGLGIHAAARALGLGFVPLASERYDLAFRRADMRQPWMGAVLEALAAPAMRTELEALGGYDAARTGWIPG